MLFLNFTNARVAQLVERQPSKLNVAGSNPVSRSKANQAGVAQLVERILGRDEVTGSNPVIGSKSCRGHHAKAWLLALFFEKVYTKYIKRRIKIN